MKSASFLLLAASLATLHAQGPLTPPGAPAPTMKTLAQIEGRTPIESLPFTISEAGSYYFTGNLQFTEETGHAITITSDNVTLDLNGFTLSSSAEVTGEAIRLGETQNNVEIKNGNIVGSSTATINGPSVYITAPAGFSMGISAPASNYRVLIIAQLRISSCRQDGIFVPVATITDCNIHRNAGHGINSDFGCITRCTSTQNNNYGMIVTNGRVTDSVAARNGSIGIEAANGIVAGCTTTRNGTDGISAANAVISNSISTFNHFVGIRSSNGVVSGCSAFSNEGTGIRVIKGTVTNCRAVSNNTGNLNFGTDMDVSESSLSLSKYGASYTAASTLTGNN